MTLETFVSCLEDESEVPPVACSGGWITVGILDEEPEGEWGDAMQDRASRWGNTGFFVT